MSTITVTIPKTLASETRSVVTMALRGNHWRIHDEKPPKLPGTIIRGTTRPIISVVEYTTVYQIREGTRTKTSDHSEYFAAVRGAYTIDDIRRRELKPEYVLRVVPTRDDETYPITLRRLQHEIDMSRLIGSIPPAANVSPLCESEALCIDRVFVTVAGDEVVEVYQYYEAVTLREFVDQYFYDSFEASHIDYWLTLVDIAIRLLHAVGYLNAMGIYHRNINPDNILVQMERRNGAAGAGVPRVIGLRLQNFEISCALLTPEATALLRNRRSSLLQPASVDNNCGMLRETGNAAYELVYSSGTQRNNEFRDPEAFNINYRWVASSMARLLTSHKAAANSQWPKLEACACGEVIMWMVDRDQMTLRHPDLLAKIFQRRGAFAIRKTRRCFTGLKSMLFDMTELDVAHRLSALHYGGRFELLRELLNDAKETNQPDLLINENAPPFTYDEP